MARAFAKSFYHSKEWAKVREAALIRDGYICARCGRVADDVHHIIHLTPENIGDPRVTMSLDNLECLCRECHMREHAEDKADGIRRQHGLDTVKMPKYHFDADGYLVEDTPR